MAMTVFISWSGSKSQAIANALRDWMPNVIQFITPWMSGEDIEKGARWSSDIATQLQNAKAGIICLTSDNLDSRWIHFEAGALSKTLENTFVCPYLFGVEPTDIKGPLVQFQTTNATKEDTCRLVHTINRSLGEHALDEYRVQAAFHQWWPLLEEKLKTINLVNPQLENKFRRTERELIEETLELVRGLERARHMDEMLKTNEKYARALADLSLAHMRKQPMDEAQLRSRIEKQAELLRYIVETSGLTTETMAITGEISTGEVVSQNIKEQKQTG
jgi:hypothetical protein